ncbi:hypothetical protein GCM10011529_24520 [Polymorphobacter glacialis]|uniref:DUF2786 domain-containing protein n=1 Tax=Sandarakinorhabdus glacialis TaxID=1614636 RepID=A0A916ZX48_9SPHN|nr:DUF2786 domain-containing protein [Polymorphobacter glacialis]GGE17134.1 hypothetical protein GCM10011529_24520 [Polymorphobacter glacialis]
MNDPTSADRLRTRIEGLRAKTLENGCTEAEAMLAAAKVAEMLDRYSLSLSDVEVRAAVCERRSWEAGRKKRVPLDGCIGEIAAFCDCKVWREKSATKEVRHVFFGLPADVDAALFLAELVDHAVRSQLGVFKTSPAYREFRHTERHLANASFVLGMVASIGDKLMAMKAERDRAQASSGRDLVVLKISVVAAELDRLDVQWREIESTSRMISPAAYEAGEAAGAELPIAGRER